MARRRKRRRKSSYEQAENPGTGGSSPIAVEGLSPRARRLVEGGVIDLEAIEGSGEGGRVTSGDILHAARLMEMEQSVARIEKAHQGRDETEPSDQGPEEHQPQAMQEIVSPGAAAESATFTAVDIGGEPISVEPTPWDDYNETTEGLAESARPGAEQSWGEAEAHLAAMAEDELAVGEADATPPAAPVEPEPAAPVAPEPTSPVASELPVPVPPVFPKPMPEPPPAAAETATPAPEGGTAEMIVNAGTADSPIEPTASPEPTVNSGSERESVLEPAAESREVMMDFGTLELVDPESVWAQGAEDFAPWFLAHSRQLGAVLGLNAGLSEARQLTTKSATGVLGRDDNGEDVVVVSSKNAVAEDSDLGRALGMAASSGAATVALVSASIREDQLKALAWLNNQTKSGVKWYGIEMRVVRIADSPAAMLFDLVASPPPP